MHLCYTSSRYFPILPILSFLPSKWRLPRHKFAKKIYFQKVSRDFDRWKERFPVAKRDPTRFHQEFLRPQGKQFEAPHRNFFYRIIKRFEDSGGVTRRSQTEEDGHMAVTPENIKRVDDYSTAEIVAHSVNAALWISSEVVVDPLDVFGGDCHASVFFGLASSGHAPWSFKVLDYAIEGILVRGLKLFSLWPKGLFNEILLDLGWRPESAPLNDQNLFRLFESEFFGKFVAWEPSFWWQKQQNW